MKHNHFKKLAACAMSLMLLVGMMPAAVLAMPEEYPEVISEEADDKNASELEGDQNNEGNFEATDEDSNLSEDENSEDTLTWDSENPEESEDTFAEEKSEDGAEPAEEIAGALAVGKIYIGGTGDDANDGLTAATPVKTFAKAKELLTANNADVIAVVSTVEVTTSEKWDLGGKTMIRDESFISGDLVSVGATLEIENMILDDGYDAENNSSVSGSVIKIYNASMRLGSGTVIQNGHNKLGGGIYGSGSGMIYFDGGIVKDCTSTLYGGGIYSTAKVVMSKGSVENCHSDSFGGGIFIDGNTLQIANAKIDGCSTDTSGGGVYAANGAKVTMTSDANGAISNCTAKKNGGGIYLSGIAKTSSLTMYSGSISGNTAGIVGGGIMSSHSVVYICNGSINDNTAGKIGGGMILTDGSSASIRSSVGGTDTDGGVVYIKGNEANGVPDGNGSMLLSGGGIYVDGRTQASEDSYYPVSKLYMDNFIVSDNSAGIDGGGLASCPTGSVDIHIIDGSAIYDNSVDSGSGSDDIMIIRNGTTTADGTNWVLDEHDSTVYIPASMLGGGAYHWKGADGKEIPLNELYQVREFRSGTDVSADSDEANAANALATVFIQNNRAAGIGGGVATNGLLQIGKVDEEVVDFSVTKSWVDAGYEKLRPEKISIQIKQNGEDYGFVYVEPKDDGSWKTEFTGLPKNDLDGNPYVYTVEETAWNAKGGVYNTSYSANGETEFTVSNTFVPSRIKVVKTDMNGRVLSGAEFILTKDEEGTDILNRWSSSEDPYELLLQPGVYYLTEKTAPTGYKVLKNSVKIEYADDGIISVSGDAEDADKIIFDENEVKITVKNEMIPETPKTPDAPKNNSSNENTNTRQVKSIAPSTGDRTSTVFWSIVLLISTALISSEMLMRRRKYHN